MQTELSKIVQSHRAALLEGIFHCFKGMENWLLCLSTVTKHSSICTELEMIAMGTPRSHITKKYQILLCFYLLILNNWVRVYQTRISCYSVSSQRGTKYAVSIGGHVICCTVRQSSSQAVYITDYIIIDHHFFWPYI